MTPIYPTRCETNCPHIRRLRLNESAEHTFCTNSEVLDYAEENAVNETVRRLTQIVRENSGLYNPRLIRLSGCPYENINTTTN
jgi:hypothetical protein